jgi:hypothetical protein
MTIDLEESDITVSENHLMPVATCVGVDVGLTGQEVYQCHLSALTHARLFGFLNDEVAIQSDCARKIRRAALRIMRSRFDVMTAQEKVDFLGRLRAQRERWKDLGIGRDRKPPPYLQ